MLLQQLGVVQSDKSGEGSTGTGSDSGGNSKQPPLDPKIPSDSDTAMAERYVINLMTTQALMGMQVLVENIQEQVPTFEADDAVRLIHSLCDTNRLQMLDPNAKPKNQLLCWVPN